MNCGMLNVNIFDVVLLIAFAAQRFQHGYKLREPLTIMVIPIYWNPNKTKHSDITN
jgi:hypothetical protein